MALDAVTVHDAVASQTSPARSTSKVWISISITDVPSSVTQRHPGNDFTIASFTAATTFSLDSVFARRSKTFRFHVLSPPGHGTSASGYEAGRTAAAAEQPTRTGNRIRRTAAARDMAGSRTAGGALLVPRCARGFLRARNFFVVTRHGFHLRPQVFDELRRREGFGFPPVGQDEAARLAEGLRRQLEDRFAVGADLDLLFRMPDHFTHFARGLRRKTYAQPERRVFSPNEDAERVAEKHVGVEVARDCVAFGGRLRAL